MFSIKTFFRKESFIKETKKRRGEEKTTKRR